MRRHPPLKDREACSLPLSGIQKRVDRSTYQLKGQTVKFSVQNNQSSSLEPQVPCIHTLQFEKAAKTGRHLYAIAIILILSEIGLVFAARRCIRPNYTLQEEYHIDQCIACYSKRTILSSTIFNQALIRTTFSLHIMYIE